jgi:hypothetical protein
MRRGVQGVRLGGASIAPCRVKGFFRRFHFFLQSNLAIAGLRAHSKFMKVSRLLPRAPWLGGVFNPAPTLEKESLYELDDQRSPS